MKYFQAVVELGNKTTWKSKLYSDQKEAEKANVHYQEVKKTQGYKITDHFIMSSEI